MDGISLVAFPRVLSNAGIHYWDVELLGYELGAVLIIL